MVLHHSAPPTISHCREPYTRLFKCYLQFCQLQGPLLKLFDFSSRSSSLLPRNHVSEWECIVSAALDQALLVRATAYMSSRNHADQVYGSLSATTINQACPYHAQLLVMGGNAHLNGLHPMDRFLAEGPSEQSALFIRADTGRLSTNKGCICKEVVNTT